MKGQSSIELIVIFAVSLIALGAIISLSNSQMNTLNAQKQKQTALTSVNDLAGAVKDVYSQGTGAKKKVFFRVPGNVDESRSGVSDKSIYLNVLGSDIIASTEVEVSGSIPTEKGGYWLWVTAGENYVIIGTSSITLSNNSFYVSMLQNSSESEQLGITNNGSSGVEIGIETEWIHSEVTLALSDTNFSVAAADTNTIDLDFSSSITAVGNYTGNLVIDVNYGSETERIIVPVNVEVIVSGDGGGEALFVFPPSYASTISAGGSDTNSFNLCNNSASDLGTVSFNLSSGDAGEWVEAIPDLSSLAAGNCESISFTINVPGGTSGGVYTGTITATDGTNSDTLSLLITVPAAPAIYFVDLWEIQADRPQPLDFTTDINSTANTFGADAGNDGWDWSRDVYGSGVNNHCVRFNADPNYDNSIADSTIGTDNRIIVAVGDYGCENSGTIASGAYGVQFDINSDHYALLGGGGTATLTFDWWLDNHGLDNQEEGWIKARIGNASGMNYLGSNLDAGDDAADAENEIMWDNNPNNQSGSENIDVSSYITAAGSYYLEFGGKVHEWNRNNEYFEAEFDNINLVIQ